MSDDHRLSRRAALGVGVLALAATGTATGCDLRNPVKSAADQPLKSSGLAPDVKVAAEAIARIRTTEASVNATVQRFPGLKPRLSPLLGMHKAHLATLDDAVPEGGKDGKGGAGSTTDKYVVPARRSDALTSVVAAERSMHASLVGLALRAESGPFARLLASMAAGTSQRLAVIAK